jgi:hypothetical protein
MGGMFWKEVALSRISLPEAGVGSRTKVLMCARVPLSMVRTQSSESVGSDRSGAR